MIPHPESQSRMNPRMRRVWQAALALLKPRRKDLEHGLALHAESLVWDAYGFAPGCAPDARAVNAAIRAGASDSELQDLVESARMSRWLSDARERDEYLRAWEVSGVHCIFQNAGEECQAPLRILKRLARFTHVMDMAPTVISRAARPDDVAGAPKRGVRHLYLTTNGIPLAQEWNNVVEEVRFIRLFFQLGVRMMHLTYNRRNMIGDGCGESSNAGLSDFGRTVIAEMNRVGVLVDVAHSGARTCIEAAQLSQKPVVASHAVCRALNPRCCRGKPDPVLRALASSGGYTGICMVPPFLGRSHDLLAMLDHVDHAVRKVGADHVAIGTDWPWLSSAWKREQARIRGPRTRTRWANFWPPDDPYTREKGWESTMERRGLAWTNWPLITVGLVQRGHSDEAIRKIIGGNVLRVARAVFPKPVL